MIFFPVYKEWLLARLQWLDHVERMEDSHQIKFIHIHKRQKEKHNGVDQCKRWESSMKGQLRDTVVNKSLSRKTSHDGKLKLVHLRNLWQYERIKVHHLVDTQQWTFLFQVKPIRHVRSILFCFRNLQTIKKLRLISSD